MQNETCVHVIVCM